MHLSISVDKTKLMVFHSTLDTGVEYHNDSVYCDGVEIHARVYDKLIKAVRSFKYLGVTLDEHGSFNCHRNTRGDAFKNAGCLLRTGLRRLPGFSYGFLVYLWQSLVIPVFCYGWEVFDFDVEDLAATNREDITLWRSLLQ
eukprot:5365410-Karenia_brevis.AAC.1